MKKRIELQKTDEVIVENSTIKRMECYPDKIEIELGVNNRSDDFNFIWINSNGSRKKHNFTQNVIIELLHDWDVICEDWIEDGSELKRTHGSTDTLVIEGIGSNSKIDRRLGQDISLEFCREIDLTKAEVKTIQFNENYSNKYELILNAPYMENNIENDNVKYYSGPFRIFSTKVRIILD